MSPLETKTRSVADWSLEGTLIYTVTLNEPLNLYLALKPSVLMLRRLSVLLVLCSAPSTRRSPSTQCAAGSRFRWSRISTWRRSLTALFWSAAGRSARVTWFCPVSWRWLPRWAPPPTLPPPPRLLPPPPPPPLCPTPPCLQGAAIHLTTPEQVGHTFHVFSLELFSICRYF